MHETIYANAALPATTRVLGLELLPYSLGHELFLTREDTLQRMDRQSVEASDRQSVDADTLPRSNAPTLHTADALMEAVLICSQTFEECRAMRRDPLILLKIAAWKFRVRRKLKVEDGRWKMEDGNSYLASQLRVFRMYRQNGSLELPLSEIVHPGRTSGRLPGAPFLLRVHQFLTIRLGLSQTEAWDYPWGLAKVQFAAYYESEGCLEIYNAHELEADRAAAEFEEEELSRSKN